MADDAYGSWQARRDILNELFEPIHLELARREDGKVTSTLARSEQDYWNIGNDCVAVLERLSDAAFDPDEHLPDGDEASPVATTKLRFKMIIDSSASGSDNAEIQESRERLWRWLRP